MLGKSYQQPMGVDVLAQVVDLCLLHITQIADAQRARFPQADIKG